MFQLLQRFHDVQLGTITLDGVELRSLALPDLRGAYALVPQDAVLFGASAADNIRYGRIEASDAEVEAAARAAEAHEFIIELPQGYDTYLGERGLRLPARYCAMRRSCCSTRQPRHSMRNPSATCNRRWSG